MRYSVLLDLPYFDPVRFTVIDPMHNLYLALRKTCIQNLGKDSRILIEYHHFRYSFHISRK